MSGDRRDFLLGTLAAGLGLSVRSARAQGFAGLGSDAEGFALPRPGHRFTFPADHGAHPGFRIEWWYLTANLQDSDGRAFGVQWTLFRSALRPGEASGWRSPQVWMGHAAATSANSHAFGEKLARGGVGQAGVTAAPFAAWIDDWRMAGPDLSTLRLRAHGAGFAYDLTLRSDHPLIFHGQDGYSVKSASGQASYYYSQPAYQVAGALRLDGAEHDVTGHAWLDREWSSQPLAADQSGWDWFSLSFAGGERLMAFRLRGGSGDYTSGTWIAADGSTQSLPNGALRLTPGDRHAVAGRQVPVTWRVDLPQKGLDIEVTALNPNAWMGTQVAYWEGPVRARGSHPGTGYLEMTGY